MIAEHSTTTPEVFPWLKTLPLAPEYHPTIQEFQDPIAYTFKIEKEASKYGICKIVPPLPLQPRKSVISNFNRSLSLSTSQNPSPSSPTFSTRQQQVGFCPRKQRPIQKSVWQSGECCTLLEFEAKAKNFEKNYMKNRKKKTILPLEVETLYWKANGDRPFTVEYANDMAGSAFVPMRVRDRERERGEQTGVMMVLGRGGSNVGDSAWNMRGVARANGSLLRFMKEDIPGVTSPMLYVAMMFSWFAWHVEDHDLHSLNYLHLGSGKTWYGVPRDAALAFEEVMRVHGFGEEINPLVTFATLGEKTAVMSPEVLDKAGVPCCRLVQNAGEFVITFPRAYHCGFSHGFNCGEASNIATPEWLKFAKDAAIRRASINYPPMVSHFQLLYDLALSICSRGAMGSSSEPRSSRLKDKKKGEGETLIKQMFVEDVVQNNELLSTLGQGSEVVLLPHNSSEKFVWSNLRVGSKYKVKPGLPFSLYSSEEAIEASDDIMLARDIKQQKGSHSVKGKFTSTSQKNKSQSQSNNDSMFTLPLSSKTQKQGGGGGGGDELSDRGLFSCVKCGIWTFACVAIVQPTESTAQYLMSADSSFLNDLAAGSILSNHGIDVTDGEANPIEPDSFSGFLERNARDELDDIHVKSSDYQIQSRDNTSVVMSTDETNKRSSYSENKNESSALGLLAIAYGQSSDSDEDDGLPDCPALSDDNISADASWGARFHNDDSVSPTYEQCYYSGVERDRSLSSSRSECGDEGSPWQCDLYGQRVPGRANSDESECGAHDCSIKFTEEEMMTSEQLYSPIADENDTAKIGDAVDLVARPNFPFTHKCDEDSSRMHVFCLEHAVEVEKLLRPIGGVRILLLCHPDYPKVEAEAKRAAEELGMNYAWNDITFSEATKEDEERIQLTLQSEEATPKNGDWAVKLGINLFYSAILSRSPLYNKQMPYNSVIYTAFGCTSPSKSSAEAKVLCKRFGRQKKLVVAGKWCGKVWMSNQVHPLLVQRDHHEMERTTETCLNRDEEIGGRSETSKRAQSAPVKNRRVARKRSSTGERRKPAKKLKFEPGEFSEIDPGESKGDKPEQPEPRRCVRKLSKKGRPIKRIKPWEEEIDPDVSEGGKPEQPEPRNCVRKSNTKSRTIKRIKPWEEEIPQSGSEDSTDDKLLAGPWRSARSFGKNPTHKAKVQQNSTMDGCSDDSLDNDRYNHHTVQKSSGRKAKPQRKPMRKVKAREKEEIIMGSESEGLRDDDEATVSQWQVSEQFDPASEEDEIEQGGPSTRLRKRTREIPKPPPKSQIVANTKQKNGPITKNDPTRKGPRMRLPKPRAPAINPEEEEEVEEGEFVCDIEGCSMSFGSKQELTVHKRNICPVKGCGKKFFSHKYLVQHRRVHMDDRPLRCPWKGCRMTFKWAWARTEHIRVHTGARPYICNEPGCGQTFRFVSDFSRHKRKTGHAAKKTRK